MFAHNVKYEYGKFVFIIGSKNNYINIYILLYNLESFEGLHVFKKKNS